VDEQLFIRVNRICATIFPLQGCQQKREEAKELQQLRYKKYIDQLLSMPADQQEQQVQEWETRYSVIVK
jgi:hypothetical protein